MSCRGFFSLILVALCFSQTVFAKEHAQLIRGQEPITELSFESNTPEVRAFTFVGSPQTFVHLLGKVTTKHSSLNFGEVNNPIPLNEDSTFDVWAPIRKGKSTFLALIVSPSGKLIGPEKIELDVPELKTQNTELPQDAKVVRLKTEVTSLDRQPTSRFELSRFQLGFSYGYQSSSNYSTAGFVGYAPKFNVGLRWVELVPNLDAFFFKDLNGKVFPFVKLGLDFRFPILSSWALAAGGGGMASYQSGVSAQYFLAADGGIAYILPSMRGFLRYFQEIQLSYHYLAMSVASHVFTLGIGIHF